MPFKGILTSSIKERLDELEKLREELKISILQAELEKPKYSREDIIEWISRFKYGDPNNKEYQRQIIDIFLNSIYVFDDRLVFTYNYKNGTQTVSLADVSAVFGSDLKSCTPPGMISQFTVVSCDIFIFPLHLKPPGFHASAQTGEVCAQRNWEPAQGPHQYAGRRQAAKAVFIP